MNKSLPALIFCVSSACCLSLGASITPVSYDFGTDPGKITYQDAGFFANSDSNLTISNMEDSVRFITSSNNQTGGITRTFNGLGDNAKNNFTIDTQFQMGIYQSFQSSFWRPASVLMFANGDSEGSTVTDIHTTGIAVMLRSDGTSNADATSLQILGGGILGDVFTSVAWTGDLIIQPDRFNLTVDVSFSGTNDMEVSASLTRLGDDVTITASHFFADSADTYIGGDHFGFGGRLQMGSNFDGRTELESFSVIPEPSTYALMAGLAVLGLVMVRRRRS